VEKGAVLARLDDTEARLAVERAELNEQSARRESERGKQLGGQGFLSTKQLDDLDLACAALQWNWSSAATTSPRCASWRRSPAGSPAA
jgi:multidrug resistance efflux pump